MTAENRTAGTTGTPYAKSYTYDGFSNRVELVENTSETDYTYDAANRLLNSTAGGVVTQYTYNNRGDLLTAQEGTETATQYTYDVFGKQTTVVGEGLNAAYTYYPDDLRKTKTVNGVTTTYVWDGDQIVLELTAGAVSKYIRGLQLIACVSGDNISYYHHDGHGNVVQLSDTSGVVTRTYEYDAFGEQLNTDAADANPFRYCGEYYDAETNTYYLRARHYSVDLGRFTQQDTIMDGLNWYVYCNNNPVSFVDPCGLFDYDDRISVSHIYNEDVEVLQNELKRRGFYNGLINGVFGKDTLEAVNLYKFYNGLGNTGKNNGIVGIQTWTSLGLIYRSQADIDAGVEITTIKRKQYKDFSVPINNALNQITLEAESKTQFNYLWFYEKVNHNADWDIKRESPWNRTIAQNTYPGFGTKVMYNGNLYTPEQLGNYTYGYIGAAMGMSDSVLILGSWYAAGFPIQGAAWENEYNDRTDIMKGYFAYSVRGVS